jgi:hypothetical protein
MEIPDFFRKYNIEIISEASVEILLAPANGINAREFYTDLESIYKSNFRKMHKELGIIYNYSMPNCSGKCPSSQILKYLQHLEKLNEITEGK